MRSRFIGLLVIFSAWALPGCTPSYYIDESLANYESIASQIKLGDPLDHVVPLLETAQANLDNSWKKRPERYTKNGTLVEIYFARTARQADGITTDDEFTPYVFNDGKLVAIGWTSIGGAKSQGQARSVTNINVTNSTIVY